jgi:hypothetical protein
LTGAIGPFTIPAKEQDAALTWLDFDRVLTIFGAPTNRRTHTNVRSFIVVDTTSFRIAIVGDKNYQDFRAKDLQWRRA